MGDCIKSEITAEIWNFVMASEHIMTRDFSCHHSWRPDLIKTKILGASFVRRRIGYPEDPLPERLSETANVPLRDFLMGTIVDLNDLNVLHGGFVCLRCLM